MTKAPVLPTLWMVVLAPKGDAVASMQEIHHSRSNALFGAARLRELYPPREARIWTVRYEAAPRKRIRTTAARALKNFDKTFGSLAGVVRKPPRRRRK